jgi:hypothetical protein
VGIRPSDDLRSLHRLLMILDNKVATEFHQIVEGTGSKPCQISAHLCPSLHLPIHQNDSELDLIQVLRDLKMTDQTKSDLIQVSRDLKMTYPSLLRLENDLPNKNQTSSKPRET